MTKESRLGGILEWCSIIVLVVMFSAVIVQIYARYFLEVAPAWTEEVGQYLLVWLTALGAGIALRSEGGFRGAVEFITNAMPSRLRHSVNLVFMAFTLGFLCVLGFETFHLVARKMEVRTPALEIPESYLYLGVFVMAVLMVWGLAYHIRKEIRTLAAGCQKPERAPSSHGEGLGEG